MKSDKDKAITELLNKFMLTVTELPANPNTNIRHAIAACLRFASTASQKIGMSIEDFERELAEQWVWSKTFAGSKNKITPKIFN